MNRERITQFLLNRRLITLVATLVITVAVGLGISVPVEGICEAYGADEEALILEIVGEVLSPSVEVTVEPTETN